MVFFFNRFQSDDVQIAHAQVGWGEEGQVDPPPGRRGPALPHIQDNPIPGEQASAPRPPSQGRTWVAGSVVLAAMAHEVLEAEVGLASPRLRASLLPNRSLEEPTALLGGRLLDRQPQDMGPTGGHLFQVESASMN